MDYYLGMLAVFGFQWAPQNFETCSGQQLPVQQNAALYSLLGVTFGGNQQTYFKLPNLAGRTFVNQGTSTASGQTFNWGGSGGAEFAALSPANMPSHTHTATLNASGSSVSVQVSTSGATHETPAAGDYLAATNLGGDPISAYIAAGSAGTTVPLGGVSGGGLTGTTVTNQPAGGGQAFSIMNPYLVMNVCICVNGIYPYRP